MKPVLLLLGASLLANAALLTVILSRPGATAQPRASAAPVHGATANGSDALRSALLAGNAGALEAAGLPPELAREWAASRALARLAEKARQAQAKAVADGRWWRNRVPAGVREEQAQARRELADALRAAYGTDFGLAGSDAGTLAFLAPEKRDALRRIVQDYDEMFATFASSGPQLASDQEKLRLLRAERDRDIAALLSPEERLAYEMRTSPTAAGLRSRYGDAIESEAEFAKIYALQKAFDEKFPREAMVGRISSETMRARAEAERQYDADLRAALGDDRYAALRRASDPDLRNVESLANRLNLPATTTDAVAAARDTFAAESQRINRDAATPFPQRRTQIQELAARAKADLVRTMGAEAAEAYAQSSQWVNMLQSGIAYATNPQAASPGLPTVGNQGVYPVMPAGAAMGPRQMIVNAPPPSDGASGAATNNVQVMTFSTSQTESPAGGPTTTRSVIVAPTPGASAPATEPRR